MKPGKVEGKIKRNKHFLLQLVFQCVALLFSSLHSANVLCKRAFGAVGDVLSLSWSDAVFSNFCDFTLLVICALLHLIHQGPCLDQVFLSFMYHCFRCVFTYLSEKSNNGSVIQGTDQRR